MSSPVLCHSDIVRASLALDVHNYQEPFDELLESLHNLGFGKNLWFPTFNMDFGRSREFNPGHDPSQVGALGEYIRKLPESWRTEVPFYSVSGSSRRPTTMRLTPKPFDVWGTESIFHDLYSDNGTILFLGADFSTFTHIHYIESLSDSLGYRYDKFFPGVVKSGVEELTVEIQMHVRPPGNFVQYDWIKIFQDLDMNKLVIRHKNDGSIFSLNARQVTDFLVSRINSDPLYLLNKESGLSVGKKMKELGHQFRIRDFE
jgi:aminoglycoside N3'-acetyltransferase